MLIMKKEWIILLTGIAAVTLTSCQEKKTGTTGQLPERPNILRITCEDMSPRLGCFGDELARTPNIDLLAAKGIRYTNVYSVSGVCSPSRAALISGMYPTSFGAQHMRTTSRTASLDQITDPELLAIPVYEAVLPVGALSYPEHLRRAGYFTTNNSKTDYQNHPKPTIVFLGTNDRLIPVTRAKQYQDKMKKAGNDCKLFLFEGKEHGYFNYHNTES